jgi:hypothetical protein
MIITNQYKESEDNWSPWTVVYVYYVPVCTQKTTYRLQQH